jgi:hypothetical protein
MFLLCSYLSVAEALTCLNCRSAATVVEIGSLPILFVRLRHIAMHARQKEEKQRVEVLDLMLLLTNDVLLAAMFYPLP